MKNYCISKRPISLTCVLYFSKKGKILEVPGSGFRGGAAHFVILSGEKHRMLKNGLSENMRTESKDLSAAEF